MPSNMPGLIPFSLEITARKVSIRRLLKVAEKKACNMFNVLNENESMIREWNADEGDRLERRNSKTELKRRESTQSPTQNFKFRIKNISTWVL